MSDTILFEKKDGVAYISLNRPKAFNSFNREMALALVAQLNQSAEDDEVRAIHFSAVGKAFCAGQDLKEVTADNGLSFRQLLEEHYYPIIMAIRTIEKPIVCAVNGIAAGAGANIAFACDITIAVESANFTQAFSRIGLIPDSSGTFTLPRLVGMQRAAALTMLSEKISAQEAADMGLIYKAVPEAEFEATTHKLASKLAKMPTKGLGMTKRALNAALSNDLETQLKLETELQIEASETDDYKEGVNAFLEKRRPVFKGK